MSKENRKPNVLIIMTDQHRADFMNCAGWDHVATPNIDRIASNGVRMERAYCPYPVCVASRMSMLTGLYSHTTGAITNEDRLDWRYRTMAHHFGENGYLTGLIGKMHFLDAHNHGFEYYLSVNDWLMYLGPKAQHYANEIASHPLSRNFTRTVFDHGAGFPDVVDLWEDDHSPWVGNVTESDYKLMASELDLDDQLDTFIARESIKFMERYREQPFMLVTSFMKPHTPLFAPREFAEMFPPESIELPEPGPRETYPEHIQRRIERMLDQPEYQRKAHSAGYLACLAFADHCVGQVLDALDRLDLADDTIVVYTSDHGEMHGDHGLWQKFCLFEQAVRVPLIVSYPKQLPQGEVTRALTEQFGLYPTLIEMTGIEEPRTTALVDFPGAVPRMEAQSFADVLKNPDAEGPAAAFSEHGLRGGIPQYMIRTDRYKYIYNHGALHELYDLETDPQEYYNLIENPTYIRVAEELRAQLVEWYDPEKSPFLPD
ncbi:MAG: sulfatase [Candidatus Sumerlaeia bacterium]